MLLNRKKTSNGVRHQLNFKKFLLCKKINLRKSLLTGKKNFSGRGFSLGRITVRHKGGGTSSLHRDMTFVSQHNFSLLIGICYNPKRSAFLSLCYNFLTSKFYNCLNTRNTYPGSIVFSYKTFPELKLGSLIKIKNVPTGSLLHSVMLSQTPKYIRSAGVFGVLVQKGLTDCKLRLPSGLLKKFSVNSLCFLGSVSNPYHSKTVLGKAGRSRLKGKRPSVRGVAMNPVDHPHGGQTSGGTHPMTPWGVPTRGKLTRNKKKYV